MRHLRKYNESKDSNYFVQYIEQCFVDFIDEGNFNIGWNPNQDRCAINIKVYEDEKIEKNNDGDLLLSDIKEAALKKLEYIDKIETAFEKIKSEYPYVQYRIVDKKGFKIYLELALDSSQSVIQNPRSWRNI